jgi:acetylornithine/succinyldiaminopimelate/putrescine aminotransferase/predicted amino acid dehydrogenase
LLRDFTRGQGNYLYYKSDQGEEVEVLDLVGGYGANLLGHNHPEIQRVLRDLVEQGTPFLTQGSRRSDAAELARDLGRLIEEEWHRDYVFVFTHSGTEAVNLALLHAHLEYRQRVRDGRGYPGERPTLLVLEGSFHGVLMQAISKRDFPGPELLRVSPHGARALEDLFDHERRPGGSRLMGMLVETIQGEGGVRPVDPEFLELARKLCRRDGVPLIVDEVQTGMGRTGRLLDSFHSGISGDYVVLAKALSGGMSKIGLTLIDRSRWIADFDSYSLSTFAEDPLSSRVARQTLEILTRDRGAVMRQVSSRGEEFKAVLDAVREEYPEVIRAVRGRGLMIGVEFLPLEKNASNALRMVDESGLLGQFLAAYLLSKESIRVAPTVSANRVLRLQPSFAIKREEMDRVAEALRGLCDGVRKGDCGFLTLPMLRPLSAQERPTRAVRYKPQKMVQDLPAGIPKVAFLGHFIEADHLALWDPSFGSFQPREREQFLQRFAFLLDPKVFASFVVRSPTGVEVGYHFIGLAQTSRMYAESWRNRNLGWLHEKIDRALDLAREEGCSVVGFGGFTSIVTDNLRSVTAPSLALTTGNSYTVAAGVDAMIEGAQELGLKLEECTLGVVGALGNIASVYTHIMAPKVGKTILVGRTKSRRRLTRMRDEKIPPALRERVEISTSMESLKECHLVLAASNSPDRLIDVEHLAPQRKTLICDISIPSDCSPEVEAMPSTTVIRGGLIRAWENQDIAFPGVPLREGEMYACMAETALLGLEGIHENFSCGPVTVENVERIRQIARRHGFYFLGPKLERSL